MDHHREYDTIYCQTEKVELSLLNMQSPFGLFRKLDEEREYGITRWLFTWDHKIGRYDIKGCFVKNRGTFFTKMPIMLGTYL